MNPCVPLQVLAQLEFLHVSTLKFVARSRVEDNVDNTKEKQCREKKGWQKMRAPSLFNPRPLFCCF